MLLKLSSSLLTSKIMCIYLYFSEFCYCCEQLYTLYLTIFFLHGCRPCVLILGLHVSVLVASSSTLGVKELQRDRHCCLWFGFTYHHQYVRVENFLFSKKSHSLHFIFLILSETYTDTLKHHSVSISSLCRCSSCLLCKINVTQM